MSTFLGQVVSLSACCALLVSCTFSEDQINGQPNILLIVLDDFGYNDLGANGNPQTPTPKLDQLAKEGVRYTRHYTDSTCTATRVALITGNSPRSKKSVTHGQCLATRLDNIEFCIKDVITNGVPGDLIECGVWRGGGTIFMRGVLEILNEPARCVWVADSFEGLCSIATCRHRWQQNASKKVQLLIQHH